jgi:transposase
VLGNVRPGKPALRIIRNLLAAPGDPAGALAQRPGALERIGLLLDDQEHTAARLAAAEDRMTAVLDDLGLTALVTSIPGLSAAGAAGILAETGDPRRFPAARALVKHADLAPREKKSGTFAGKSRLTGAGRPALRLAAWRAARGAQHADPACQARYQHLTTRADNPLRPAQAQAAIAAAILRHLHAITTTGQAWDPAIAAGAPRPRTALAA